jgi:hypothetical protein
VTYQFTASNILASPAALGCKYRGPFALISLQEVVPTVLI